MNIRDHVYSWWKHRPRGLRQPLAFILGLSLVIAAPLVGWLPGPGGIVVFLIGISVLGSEFDWAKSLHIFFVKKVPAELKKRWQPTPAWETAFDITCLALSSVVVFCLLTHRVAVSISLGITSVCLFMFNRNRLMKLKKQLRKTS